MRSLTRTAAAGCALSTTALAAVAAVAVPAAGPAAAVAVAGVGATGAAVGVGVLAVRRLRTLTALAERLGTGELGVTIQPGHGLMGRLERALFVTRFSDHAPVPDLTLVTQVAPDAILDLRPTRQRPRRATA